MINLLIVERAGIGGSASYLYSFLKHLNRREFRPFLVLHHPMDNSALKGIEKLGVETDYLFENYVDDSKERLEKKIKQTKEINAKKSKLSKICGYLKFTAGFVFKEIPEMMRFFIILKRRKADLVLLNAEVIFFRAEILASKLARTPCVVRKSGFGYREGNKKINRIFSSIVDLFIASSEAEYRKHLQAGDPYKKMFTVYEGVDTGDFYPSEQDSEIRREFGIKNDQKIVGLVSRLEFGKGHLEAIKAAKIVIEKMPDVIFLIIGEDVDSAEGSFRSLLESEVKRLNLENNFIFSGWRSDIAEILHTIDLFVHCPNEWREAMGIATLEAMACGKPVIVTDNDGLAETTIDGFNGFKVPKGDCKAIAQKIILLLGDEGSRNKMGINSRKRAEEKFDIKKNIRVFERILLDNFSGN